MRFSYVLLLSFAAPAVAAPLRFVSALADGQTAAPSFPQVCNVTNDVAQSSYAAQLVFDDENSQCVSNFQACLQQGGSTASCSFSCTVDLDLLASDCLDTFCEVSGYNAAPSTANMPPFRFRTGMCVPEGCDADQHDALQAYLRYQLCGSGFYGTADCDAIILDCAYDVSPSQMWIIVGSVAGAFALCMGGVCLWWWCSRARTGEYEDEDGHYEDAGSGSGGLHEELFIATAAASETDPYAVPGAGGPALGSSSTGSRPAYVPVVVDANGVPLGIVPSGSTPAAAAAAAYGAYGFGAAAAAAPPIAPAAMAGVARAEAAAAGGADSYTYAVRNPRASGSADASGLSAAAAAPRAGGRASIAPIAPAGGALRAGPASESDRIALMDREIDDAIAARPVAPTRANLRGKTQDAILSADEDKL